VLHLPEVRAGKLSQHRPDVLTDPNYWADEDIEECLE
jgi:hypothetical protein